MRSHFAVDRRFDARVSPMSSTALVLFVVATACALAVVLLRRAERRAHAVGLAERRTARERGSHAASLQHPVIDLEQCIGCGACVRACPEDGVLAMLHGQAAVVHGARCVGHGRCADACPVGAVAITLGDLRERSDLPALSEEYEAVGAPGLFVAGELGGLALVRTAVVQGSAVADVVVRRTRQGANAVARRWSAARDGGEGGTAVAEAELLDLIVVGAGPAGLACALRAREHGLRCVTLEQAGRIGGSVAGYPRRKLVMTQPMRLPLHGTLPRLSYAKEELIEVWESVAREHALDVRCGVRVGGLRRGDDGWRVQTAQGELRARNVCLALGRRGTPRKLGVPGEDGSDVQYALLDAESWRGCRVLVVGGGDSAIEGALALAAQPGNTVTLAYRKAAFFRLKARNEAAIEAARRDGSVRVLFETEPVAFGPGRVELAHHGSDGASGSTLEVDGSFVLIGGVPPFELLREAGVSFDPHDRPASSDESSGGSGAELWIVLLAVCTAGLLASAWLLLHADYYRLAPAERVASAAHAHLSSQGPLGLLCGLLAAGLFACNLTYLVRRAPRLGRLLPGSLRAWMGAHVLTGLLALPCVLVHAAFQPGDTVGGHAFVVLCAVVVAGAIGRYGYAFLPRATNGRQLDLEEIALRLAAVAGEWDREGRGFGNEVRRSVDALVASEQAPWAGGFFGRVAAIVRSRIALRRSLHELRARGLAEGVPRREVQRMLALSRRAHWLALTAAHYEEMRAVLASWRWFHRWLALLLVLLTAVHVVNALRFAQIDWSVLPWLGGGR